MTAGGCILPQDVQVLEACEEAESSRGVKARKTPVTNSSSFCNVGKVSASGQIKSGELTSAYSEAVHCLAGQMKAFECLQD